MDTKKYMRAKCLEKINHPEIKTSESAGYDLSLSFDIVLRPGEDSLVGTGFSAEIPEGYFGMVVPRSSTGKKNLILKNTVGIIDSDYRGEIKCHIQNMGNKTFLGYKGDSLFQLVLIPYISPALVFVESLNETDRSDGGFGSTDGRK